MKLTEQARVAGIEHFAQTQAVPGYEALIASMKADGSSTASDVAMAIIHDIRAQANAAGAAPDAMGRHRGAVQGFVDLAAVEKDALSAWNSNAAIRAEFSGNKDAYVALRKGEAKGLVRIFGRRG